MPLPSDRSCRYVPSAAAAAPSNRTSGRAAAAEDAAHELCPMSGWQLAVIPEPPARPLLEDAAPSTMTLCVIMASEAEEALTSSPYSVRGRETR